MINQFRNNFSYSLSSRMFVVWNINDLLPFLSLSVCLCFPLFIFPEPNMFQMSLHLLFWILKTRLTGKYFALFHHMNHDFITLIVFPSAMIFCLVFKSWKALFTEKGIHFINGCLWKLIRKCFVSFPTSKGEKRKD